MKGDYGEGTKKPLMAMDPLSLFYISVLNSPKIVLLCLSVLLTLDLLNLGFLCLTAPCLAAVSLRGVLPIPGQPAVPEGPGERASLHLQHSGDWIPVWVSSETSEQH